MFLVNSRFSLVCATPCRSHRTGVHGVGVPLLPKLRGHFAEFLNHSCLVRLGILYLTTCVGLGYGPCVSSLEAFLGSIGSPNSPQPAMHHLSGTMSDGFAYRSPYRLAPVMTTNWYGYLPASPPRLPTTSTGPTQPRTPITPKGSGRPGFGQLVALLRYGRAHTGTGISTRCPSTTPVGLALGPDSPWADWPGPGTLGLSAGKVLTCLIATHACIRTPPPSTTGHPVPSPNEGRSPTQPALPAAAASAVCLSPATLSAHNHLTSELLRTLSRMAASKPTSWLSLRLHILSHLAHA